MLCEPRVDSCLTWILCPCTERLLIMVVWQTVHKLKPHALVQKGTALAYLSVYPPNKHPALQEIHCVLSWQSSKHSRDVFRGFVFSVFTKCLGQSCSEAQDAGLHNGRSEAFGSSTEEQHTQAEKIILDGSSVQRLSCYVPSPSYWLEC